MFNYKTWKLYYPGVNPNIPDDPGVDENGNSITPDSLSKNYTDNVDAEKAYTPVTPLEKAFAKMAGDDIDIGTPRNALEYQVKRAAETGPALPEATSSDEGKVLTVSNSGSPVWRRPGPFIVTITDDGTSVTSDKTAAQIKAAIDAGLSIYAHFGNDYYPIMTFYIDDDVLSYIQFGCTYIEDSYVHIIYNNRTGWRIEEA